MHTPTPTPTANPTPAAPRRRGRRTLTGTLAGAILATGALWVWSGHEGSLATSLSVVRWLLPGSQSLNTQAVQGSLRHGGQVGLLHWQDQGLDVEAINTRLQLHWPLLRQGQLPLTALDIDKLSLSDQRPASPKVALQALPLPLKVQLPLRIGQLHWAGPPALDITNLQADYHYNGQDHRLTLAPFDIGQGRYTAQARLQAAAPMALDIQLQGQIKTASAAHSRPLTLNANAALQGTLSGPSAQLVLNTRILPAGSGSAGMQLALGATLRPWQDQPVQNATGQWQEIDLASLWPGAPHTQLSGQGAVTPDATGWQFNGQVRNANPGPWDRTQLPLSLLNTRLAYQQGLWQVLQLDAHGAAGKINGQGQQTPAGWTGQLHISGVQPAQLHTALSGPALLGQVQARTTPDGAVAVTADVRTTPHANSRATQTPTGLSWEQLHLQGQWQAVTGEWNIPSLDLRAANARLQGHVKYRSSTHAAQGQLQLSLPGLNAQTEGLLAPQQGQGSLTLDVQDAALSQAWLQRWPRWATRLQSLQTSGTGHLKAQWQGGYQQAQTTVQASVKLPRLSPGVPSGNTWQIDTSEVQVQGSLQALQADATARVTQGQTVAQMQTRWHAERTSNAPTSLVAFSDWQGQMQSLQITATPPRAASGTAPTWQAQLTQALKWQWQTKGATQALRWDAGAFNVQGPPPPGGTNGQRAVAHLSWDAGEWTTTTGQPTNTRLNARLDDWPLTWLPGLVGPELHSDVLLHGELQWVQQDKLRIQALLERSRGDLRLSADNAPGQRLNAGLRTARLQLQVDGDEVQTRLLWDSEQMGQAQAHAQTRLSWDREGWSWPEQAPLSGQLQANLPRVGAWSLLAPPGWRVQGTLNIGMTLSGTRAQPQWQGQLQADNLAVRSAVQGIEFSQGQLRARLQGQQVDLEQLSLRGAGAQGGELQAKGQVNWRPQTLMNTPANPWGEVDMALQLHAQGLRVSNRADRRLAISGDVAAQMKQGQLQLRGQVQADQALFILPEDSTPTLGSDVVVLGAPSPRGNPGSTTVPANQGTSWIGTPDVQVKLDLGPDFQVKGLGLTSRLAGQLTLTSNAASKGQPRLGGEVRTEGGRYKAYGQQLDIDSGVLRFTGPYDNPNLDIVAIRPNLSQRVGVQITGTALLPRVRLYADPDMPDADKLAWLVLGRSAAGGGAESAVLQQAAMALLSGNGKTLSGELAGALGLDEISLASGSRSDATATGTAITLGKRLSKDFYLIYEASLQGAFGSFYVFYDLSRRLTLRAQAGEVNALDLIFTVRKD